MFTDLHMPPPRIAAIQMAGAVRTLQGIANRNDLKAKEGPKSPVFVKRKERMKERLMHRGVDVTFEEATNEDGRERLLLSLYLQYAALPDASWLPPFDDFIANSVLGVNGCRWNDRLRKQASLLFFTHFDRLPDAGLLRLCTLLLEAYDNMEFEGKGPVAQWRSNCKALFTPLGHQSVARSAYTNETLPSLMQRFAVPSSGRFTESLRQVFLLNVVRECPLGKETPALAEIESLKSERASASQLMGAAALQVMVQRVAKEGGRKWSEEWSRWITKLGCDPRHGRATGEVSKWWGWATPDELRLAQQGVTGRTLKFFIRYLDGTVNASQWENRSKFLMALFDAGKIESARLALNWVAYERLDEKYRDLFSVAHLSQTSDETSMICLKCVDDVFIIEGTHSFGLRLFYKTFPIPNFWERPKQTYQDRELRISPADCPLFLPHDNGGQWVRKFFRHLRASFHVEWNDVRL